MEKHWAGLKTRETYKWPREVTHFRNKKEPHITESLNEWWGGAGESDEWSGQWQQPL